MLTIANKIRTIIALGTVGAALASTGVASAATVLHRPGSVTPIVAKQPIAVPDIKGAGSAGIPGYDDAQCESLAQDYNTAVSYGDQANIDGDQQEAGYYYNLSGHIYGQLTDNCMVMYG